MSKIRSPNLMLAAGLSYSAETSLESRGLLQQSGDGEVGWWGSYIGQKTWGIISHKLIHTYIHDRC